MPDNNDQKELTAKIGFLEAELDSLSAKLRGMTGITTESQPEYGSGFQIFNQSRWARDYVWVGGKRLAVPENTEGYAYLRVYRNGTTPPAWISEMPGSDSMLDSEIYDMTKLHIHYPGDNGWTGLPYQVLQIDADGHVIVDWLKAGP